MTTKQKQFALDQIAPYYKDPSTCGFDGKLCTYLTEDGKMCVAGKNMLNPIEHVIPIFAILRLHPQEKIFKPEAVGILSNEQWLYLQSIHDRIALGLDLENLYGFFTLEELQEAANKIQ